MIPKRKESGAAGDKYRTFDKLTIDINEAQFSIIQQAEQVRVRIFCGSENATIIARNMGGGRRKTNETAGLNLQVDDETFVSMLNPELKIVFRSNNVLAPYLATSLFKESLFSGREALGEIAMKN
jgi:thymidine phosphorylase